MEPHPSPTTPTQQAKRAKPQEPTWRKVVTSPIIQKVVTHECAPKDKGKGKKTNVTNIPSSPTCLSLLPIKYQVKKFIGPKVVTQEPTMDKTSPPKDKTWQLGKRAVTQEPTSMMEVELQ